MSVEKQFFEKYVRDRRGQNFALYTLEDLGYLIRYTPQTEAANREYKRIVVDAFPMSRPILEKMGFTHVCDTIPMCYKIA